MTDTEYYDLIRPYDDAMKLLLTRLEILNHNIYKASAENPIHTMQYRIKSKQSIEEKLIRKGEEPTLENAKDLLQDIAGMIPGMDAKALSGANVDEKAMGRIEAIIQSMTPGERDTPAILNSSRKKRIAAGCGLEVVDVNRLLKQFEMMQSMIKQVTRGGKMPKGMGGFSGGRMRGFGRKKRFK